MEDIAVAVFFSVAVYCITMIYTQDVNLRFHRDEEIRRLKDEVKELKAQLF